MNGFTFSRLPGLSRSLLALFATSAVFTAGCANMATTAIGSSSMDTTTIGGNIHGGNQPVAGATVNLWFAGQGPSTPPTIAATTTSASDGSGSFSFIQGGSGANHFTCPTLTDPLVYVVATGGNTLNNGDTSVNNTAAVFAAPFEACSKFATNPMFVNLTEVTTVATMRPSSSTSLQMHPRAAPSPRPSPPTAPLVEDRDDQRLRHGLQHGQSDHWNRDNVGNHQSVYDRGFRSRRHHCHRHSGERKDQCARQYSVILH